MEVPVKYVVDYNKIFKIELLNEFSNGIYARLLNFILKNEIDKEDKGNFYIALLNQFVEMLDLNLFEMPFEELEALEKYWENTNKYVKEVTK